MKFGVHYIDFLPGAPERLAPTLAATAKAAEDAGVEMFTLADHFFQMEGIGRAEDPFLEGYTSLGYLAGLTERITLTMLVTGVTYRHPGVLAKTMTTLDVLAGGGRCSAWAPPGTTVNTTPWASPTHRCVSASRCSRRPCRSACRCGARTTVLTRASTTASPRPSASRSRCAGRRSSSGRR